MLSFTRIRSQPRSSRSLSLGGGDLFLVYVITRLHFVRFSGFCWIQSYVSVSQAWIMQIQRRSTMFMEES